MSNGIPLDFLEYLKTENPFIADAESEQLYLFGKNRGLDEQYLAENPDGITTWEDVDNKRKESGAGGYGINSTQSARKKRLEQITTPSFMNSLYNMADYGIDENSWSVWRKAYNDSLTGKIEELITGKQRYDVSDYEEGIVNNILSGLASFVMPADLLAMRIGGKGVVMPFMKGARLSVAEPMTTLAMKSLERSAGKEFAKKGLTWAQRGVLQGTGMASVLATYEGAMGGVDAAIKGEDFLGILKGIGGGILHGGGLGFAAGFTGGGLASISAGTSSKVLKAVTAAPTQTALEAGVFTVEPAARMIHEGDFNAQRLLEAYAQNVGMFGVMKMWGKATETYKEAIKEYRENELGIKDKEADMFETSTDALIENLSSGTGKDMTKAEQKIAHEIQTTVDKYDKDFTKEVNDKGIELDNLELDIKLMQRDMQRALDPSEPGYTEAMMISEHAARHILTLRSISEIAHKNSKRVKKNDLAKGIVESKVNKWDTLKEQVEGILERHNDLKEITKLKAENKDSKAQDKIIKSYQQWKVNEHYERTGETIKPGEVPLPKDKGKPDIGTMEAYLNQQKVMHGAQFQDTLVEIKEQIGEIAVGIKGVSPTESFKEVIVDQTPEGRNPLDTPIVLNYKTKNNPTGEMKVNVEGKQVLVNELIKNANVPDKVKNEIFISIYKHGKQAGINGKQIERIIELAEHFHANRGKGQSFTKLEKQDIHDFFKEKGLDKTEGEFNTYLKGFAKFFGTTHPKGKIPIIDKKGFAGEWMGRVSPAQGIVWGEVVKGAHVSIDYSQKKLVRDTMDKTLPDKFDLKEEVKDVKFVNEKGDEVQINAPSGIKLTKQYAKDIIDFFYHLPKRSKEILSTLKVRDYQNGILKIHHSEKGGPASIPMEISKKYTPELYDILERAVKGKDKNDLIFGDVLGKTQGTRNSSLNALYKLIMKRANIKPESVQGGKVYTSHNNRHSAMTDAIQLREMGEASGIKMEFVDFVDQVILGHGMMRDARYHYYDGTWTPQKIREKYKEFNEARKLISGRTKEASKEALALMERKNALKDARGSKQSIAEQKAIDAGKQIATTTKAKGVKGSIAKRDVLVKTINTEINADPKKKTQKDVDLYTEKSASNDKKTVREVFEEVDKMSEGDFIDFLTEGTDLSYRDIHKMVQSTSLEHMKEAFKITELQNLKKLPDGYYQGLETIKKELLGEETKYRLEDKEIVSDSKKMSKSEQKEQEKWLADTLPHLKVVYKTLGIKGGKKILAQITGHLIEIDKGNSSPYSMPHEVAHNVIDFLKAAGDPLSKQLVKEGSRLFKGEHRMIYTLEKYVRGGIKDKSLAARAERWINKFWAHVRVNLLGGKFIDSKTLKNDITIILGEKILRGEIDVSSKMYSTVLQTKYRTGGPAHRKINVEIHKLEKLSKLSKQRKAELRMQAGWIPDKGKWTLKDVTVNTLERYHQLLLKDNGKGSPVKHSVVDINIHYSVSEKFQNSILEKLGVKNLDIDNMSIDQIRKYTSIIVNNFKKPLNERMDAWSAELAIQKHDIPHFASTQRSFMSVWDILKTYGGAPGKWLANRMARIESYTYTEYLGKASQQIKLIKKTGADKNAMWVVDKQRSEPLYKKNLLSKSEKHFFENFEKKGTKEFRAVELHKQMMDWFWKGHYREMSHWATEKQILQFQKKFEQKYVQDYYTRRATTDFLLTFGKKGWLMEQILADNLKSYARKEVLSEGKYKDGTDKFRLAVHRKMTEVNAKGEKTFEDKVRNYIFASMDNTTLTMKNPFLEKRGLLIKEFYTTPDGKKIRTYETSFDNTIEAYSTSMSKHLAILRFMPELTSIGKEFGIAKKARKQVEELRKEATGENPDQMGWFAQAVMEREFGLEITARDRLKKGFQKKLGSFVNLNAMAGLSSPLSGFKNLLIQAPRSVAVYGLGNTLAGIGELFRPGSWDRARIAGKLEYGSKQITREAGEASGLMKYITKGTFEWNLMRVTENINRIAISHAGKLYTEGLIGNLRGEGRFFKTFMGKKQIREFLTETMELTKDDVNFLETSKFKEKQDIVRQSELMTQIEFYSHAKSAGGTAVGMLPLWATSAEGRALTLFQRMAYVTTVDTYKNMVRPFTKYGNPMPLMAGALGHGLSGQLLYNMYTYLFNTEPPASHSSEMDKALQYMWRGEFLGVLGEFISPYGGLAASALGIGKSEREVSFNPLMEPIILRNLMEAKTNAIAWYSGGKFGDQAVMDFITKTIVVAGQYDRYTKTYNSEHYKWDKKLKTVKSTFMKDMGYSNLMVGTEAISQNQPYYRDLKEAIYFKTPAELEKEIWKTYNFLMHDAINDSAGPYSLKRQHKMTIKQILRAAKNTSPLNDLTVEDLKYNRVISKRKEFLQYLTNSGMGYEKIAKDLDKMVQYKLRKIEKILNSRQSRYENSAFPILSRYRIWKSPWD